MPKFITDDKLDNWFDHHPPTGPGIVQAHEQIRAAFKALARKMNDLLPEGPDKTVALRAIRDAAMQANATIACTQQVHTES